MKILILGGTQFVGRHIAEAFLSAGHTVSILTRGQTKDELPQQVERLRGNRDDGFAGLKSLAGRSWEACIDVSGYTPRQVRSSAELLRESVRRYVFISAVMTYGDTKHRPVRETDPVLSPAAEDVTEINGETYGPLKVACENIVESVYSERSTRLRPQIVVGPHDHTGRYTYWVNRAARGGEMLAPGDGSDHLQVIDARDLARFAVKVIEDDISGVFNLVGPRITWAEFIRTLGARNYVWVDAEIIQSADLAFGEMPLYRPEQGALSGLMDVNNDRALAAGLRLTSPETTLQDTRNWSLGANLTPALPPEKEAKLIQAARAKGALPVMGEVSEKPRNPENRRSEYRETAK